MQKICSNEPMLTDEMVYAGFFARLAAYLLDWCILLPCLLILNLPMSLANFAFGTDIFSTAVFFRFTLKDIIQYLCVLAYFVILTYQQGGTIGKRAMNLKVTTKNGDVPDLLTVFYRECVGRFLSRITLFIGYLLIGPDAEKAALHDKLSDTRVVYSKKVKVYPVVQKTEPLADYAQPTSETCAEIEGIGKDEENRL
jgi:uncharacterized RDD family membrane protein YckC